MTGMVVQRIAADAPTTKDAGGAARGASVVGGDPFQEEEPTAGAATDVIVLNNNQYSGALKRLSRDEFLRSGCVLAGLVRQALERGGNA